jgi:hypothetical protein
MYNSLASAKKKGLVKVDKSGAVQLRVSTQQYQSLRDSVRLVSKQTYVHHLASFPLIVHLTDPRCDSTASLEEDCSFSTSITSLVLKVLGLHSG